jgi:hypothetical protein
MSEESTERIIADTRRWVERAVIGLNLCPFAPAPHRLGLVHYALSVARHEDELLGDLAAELKALYGSEPAERETTLLIHPWVLEDFLTFNDFLGRCEDLIEELGLSGELQVASFHPDYLFADSPEGDMGNYTNRSPYPTLHLLREASVEKAVEGRDTSEIYLNNIRTLQALGLNGWRQLFRDE